MTAADYNNCVDQFADNVYRFVLKNIGDEEKARDVVQDAFMKMWIKKKDIEAGKSKSYLFTAAHHTMIDMIRKENRKREFEEWDVLQQRHSQNRYSDLQDILHEAVDKLPANQKSVVLLRDYEGYSYKEIAEITGLNEPQVKVYIYRARMFLRNYIGNLSMVI